MDIALKRWELEKYKNKVHSHIQHSTLVLVLTCPCRPWWRMLRRARRWRRCRARWWRARAARRRGPCAAPAAARSRACGPPRWRAAWRRSRRPRGRTRSCSACSKPSRISSIYTIDNSRYSLLSLCFHWLLDEKLEENKILTFAK